MKKKKDVIKLGTGLKECILSGLMSTAGKKVLHIDRNPYYGGESASLNLEQLYQKYRPGQQPPASLGRARDYCVDLCPKFLMACGNLVKVLLHTKVTRYLDFKSVSGSYVVQDKKVHKVPATPSEALNSGLMGIFQKRRFKNFLQFANDYEESNPKTHQGCDLNKMTTKECFDYWKLEDHTQNFTGHAIALHPDDSYLKRPAKETIDLIKLYAYSVSRYGNSPYIYPVYGLAGLPEGFSRLSAIHGGVYMLNKPVSEIVYDETGRVIGVKDTEGVVAKTKQVICDPSYVAGSNKVEKVGRTVRCICILSHPIPNTNNSDSCQIIIPFHQIPGRKTDIYILCVSYHHKIAADGKYVAVISTKLEGDDEKTELQPALNLLGPIDEMFMDVSDSYRPVNDCGKEQVFITNSYDETSHFESATNEVISLYEKITGKPIDLTISADPDDLQEQ